MVYTICSVVLDVACGRFIHFNHCLHCAMNFFDKIEKRKTLFQENSDVRKGLFPKQNV
jgi:hypothetical protein